MFNRRRLLKGILQGTPLLAMSSNVPQFLARTAFAAANAKTNKDKILVVVELAGGNDGLNMLVPYADELYYKARPTIAVAKKDVIGIDDRVGLNSSMRAFEKMLSDANLEFVQGVGYPNPIRSHFESMNIWHTADPTRREQAGWLGRALNEMPVVGAKVPAFNLEGDKAPLAFEGGPSVPTVNPEHSFGLQIGHDDEASPLPGAASPRIKIKDKSGKIIEPETPAVAKQLFRKDVIRELAEATPCDSGSLTDFVRHTALDGYSTAAKVKRLIAEFEDFGNTSEQFQQRLYAVARMIQYDFGARVFFVSLGSFDTHSNQRRQQDGLLQQLAESVSSFFQTLSKSGDADRVLLMTFSEFGRRVAENGDGTDHGSASTMILAGNCVKGGLIGQPPRLDDLADGDIKFQIDFRRVYASILEDWLKCDSRLVLGEPWPKLPIFAGV
jgi:uncharacterized protein (DUF1501 family)